MRKFAVAVLVMCLWISGCNDESTIQSTKLTVGSSLNVVEFEGHVYTVVVAFATKRIASSAKNKLRLLPMLVWH